ncbi:MAG TPA: putative 2-aminoethylphosphonate ABC transporter ATP-binding protein [Azospirillaceae bacterium]|nr:putative 2-aminoethylphosphonate ABC transporter ATP-binding protein [Azospirillaceae bacterium]HRQ82124.1 putative 2-aminoethylphosphonate ABC transporter ATP-binding protein [Azospirillaceae bacterium]
MTTTPASHSLEINDVVKSFGAFQALKGVSLAIRPGEFVCFLGPSGCGKTTLLRIVAGLDQQTAGTIRMKGRDVSRAPAAARDYGIVFQSYALFPNLTAAENIGYGLKDMKKPAREARVRELLALIGLPDIAAKYPGQLSGGQQQRVALARALAPSPGLLLLDEPLSALDARVRAHLRRQIRELHDRLGLTTIMVTHDQEEALTMADRVVVMNHGVIEQSGSPQEIYRRPATPFVADFVGAMNFLHGEAEDGDVARIGEVRLRRPPGDGLQGKITVCLRPEDVLVRAAAGPNTLEAVIENIEFLGPVHRARLNIEGMNGYRLLADLSANLVRELDLAEGRRLPVTLPPDRLRVYPAASA